MKKKTNRMEWLRVIKKRIKNLDYANKYNKQGSGMISSIAYSDGIIEVPENVQSIKKGELYNFYSFRLNVVWLIHCFVLLTKKQFQEHH